MGVIIVEDGLQNCFPERHIETLYFAWHSLGLFVLHVMDYLFDILFVLP